MRPKLAKSATSTRWIVFFFTSISSLLVVFQIQSSISISTNDVVPVDAAILPRRNHQDSVKQDPSFSACLITMDDNHFLIEFLAYHWHTLPLKRLIVAVDTRSNYSPTPIFDRYRGLMEITQWTDTDFMLRSDFGSNNDTFRQFFQRQLEFYAKCLGQLKKEGRSWALLIDTDEFITPNHFAAPDFRISNMTNTTILAKLEQIQAANVSTMMSSPCVFLPRLRYGTKESSDAEVQQLVPTSFSGMDFMTLRWRWRAKSAFGKNQPNPYNGQPKGMVNLQYLEDWMVAYGPSLNRNVDEVVGVHRPVKTLCSEEDRGGTHHRHASFVVHHYPGTLEQWTFRNDGRSAWTRNKEAYQGLAKRARQLDNSIRPWLQDFVQAHGEDLAHRLLDGVGRVSSNSIALDATTRTGVEKKATK
jgi:hypothetical protein